LIGVGLNARFLRFFLAWLPLTRCRRCAEQIFIVVEHFLYEYSTRQPKPHWEPAEEGRY